MAVRSARLAFGGSSTGVVTTLYTVPSGKTALVKDVRVAALTGAATRIAVFADSGGARVSVIDQPLGNLGVASAVGFMVLEPGDTIGAFATGNACTVWVSGAELDGLAP